jgi:hypothetical protein
MKLFEAVFSVRYVQSIWNFRLDGKRVLAWIGNAARQSTVRGCGHKEL